MLSGMALSQSLDSVLSSYSEKFPQERLHIHFDKDTYLPGETIWLKVYLLSDAKPTSVSKNLYLDWTDANGRLILHSVSPVNEGGASSFFKIPSWVKNGVIHVKAYTQWMLNFDSDFLFNKDIPVLMPLEGSPVIEKDAVSLQFFPEGGDLINGVSSVVAFEALNQHGKPVQINGILLNNNTAILDSLHTSYNGMGSFRVKPVSGEQYIVKWTGEDGEPHSTSLPPAKANGLVLHVDPYENHQLHINLEKSEDAANLTKIVLIGTIHQKAVFRASVNLEKNPAEINIPADNIPCGILQLTAFNSDMKPLAERVVFINNQKVYGTVHLKKDAVDLNKRGRNEYSVEIPDSLITNLSVSVTDAGLGYDSSTNIYSDLLLAGDLKGEIPDAASFLSNSDHINEHLNLLLLTHGWRRFNWDAVVSGRFPELKFPRDNGFLAVNGEVRNVKSLDDQDSISLLMISRDKKKHLLKMPVNAEGKFGQGGLFFYDSVQVVYRFNHADKITNNAQIGLYADLLPPLTPAKADDPSFSWVRVPDVILEKEMNGHIIESNDYSVASNSMNYILSPQIDMPGKNSENAAHYLADNFINLRFPVTLRETGPGSENKFASYRVNGTVDPQHSNVNVTLDGAAVAMEDLKSIPMKEILFIKFISKPGLKSLPTLAITSRQAIDQANILENKTGYAVIRGYTPVREFYEIKYTATQSGDIHDTDFRSTLYWNPNLRLDKTHRKSNFVFYNNDISSKLRIVIEGINQEGKIYRLEEIVK
jgi:hypothetical protein